MWPWGHLAVGYLCYSLLIRRLTGRPPTDAAALALTVGTQFPDLVDKPLAWTLGFLPNGRSLAHSLLTAGLLIALLFVLTRGVERRDIILPFSVGYLSHLVADALPPVIAGEFYYVGFLAWPLVPAIQYETDPSFLAHLQGFELTPFVAVQFLLAGLTIGVWLRDGAPGVGVVRSWACIG